MGQLIDFIDGLAKMTSGQQHDYYITQLNDAKEVKIEKMADVLTPQEIRRVRALCPEKKMCYKNALEIARALGCEYVDGQMLFLVSIDHAFNKIRGHYFDATREIALQDEPSGEYIAFGEYTYKTAAETMAKRGVYCSVYDELYIQKHPTNGTI